MNLGLSNFGLKSYLWFQIELVLRARWILKSRIWMSPNCPPLRQIYHYKYHIFELRINKWRWRWRINEFDCIWMYVMCFNCGLITNKSGKVRSSRISNLCRVRSLNFNFDFSFYFPKLWRNFVKLYYPPSLFGEKKTPTTVFKIFYDYYYF